MRSLTAILALVIAALGSSEGMSQDPKAFRAAKRSFDRAMKGDDEAKRLAAIRHVRGLNDPATIELFTDAITRVDKQMAKTRKKLDPLLKQRQELGQKLDKRVGNKTSVALGSVKNLLDKRNELERKIAPIEASYRLEAATKRRLMEAVGQVITSLPSDDQQTAATTELVTAYDKISSSKEDDKVVYLEMLGFVHTPPAAAALAHVVLDADSPDLRVMALTSLARLGDPAGTDAAIGALEDDFWQVRAAAVAAIRQFGSEAAIPKLIDRLGTEEGRLRGDVIVSLNSLCGVTYHDNAALWSKWWDENGQKLGEVMSGLRSDQAVDRTTALEIAATNGYLIAARDALDGRGLSRRRVASQEALRLEEPDDDEAPGGGDAGGVSAEAHEADVALAKIGEIIGTRPKKVREVAFRDLLAHPFRATRDVAKRVAFVEVMGRVDTAECRDLLKSTVINAEDKARRQPEKIAAVRSLGTIGNEGDVDFVAAIFRRLESDVDIYLAAADALGRIATKKAVGAMVNALGEISSSRASKREKLAGVTSALAKQLRDVTKATPGDDFDAWNGWWRENRAALKTERDEALAAAEGTGDDDEGSGTKFYGIETYSKRIAYVLDVSGSMSEPAGGYANGVKTKLDVAKEELLESIRTLPDGATFNIIFYSTDFRVWKKKNVVVDTKSRKEVREWIAKVQPAGNTNIFDPLVKSFELAGRGSFDKRYGVALDTIFFLSDGQPNQGRVIDPADILREITSLNALKRVQIHTVGVGKGHNAGFMMALAQATGGSYVARE